MWKRQYTDLGVQDLRELRSLREENGRLKWIVADLTGRRRTVKRPQDSLRNLLKFTAARRINRRFAFLSS
jgi:hypothetical protein